MSCLRPIQHRSSALSTHTGSAARTLSNCDRSRRLVYNATRSYASQTSLGTTSGAQTTRHKRVTVFNDDGRVAWGQLTAGEKAARATQQSFNFTLIAVGAAATVAVFFYLYMDVFSLDSPTRHYDRAVDRIKADSRCIDLLGPKDKITAYGEPQPNTFRKITMPSHRIETDKAGTQRLYMHWEMQGPRNSGVVRLFMLKRADDAEFSYGHLYLDVRGHSRIYLENSSENEKKTTPGTFLGIRWTR